MGNKLLVYLIVALMFSFSSAYALGNAHAIGLGGAMTAVIDNPDSVFYNPAAIQFKSSNDFTGGYKASDNKTNGFLFGYTHKITDNDLVGIGYDGLTANLAMSTAESTVGALSYAHKINDQINLGILLNSYSNVKYAGTLGLIYSPFNYLTLGFKLNNIIRAYQDTSLATGEVFPSGFSAGASFVMPNSIIEKISIDCAKYIYSDDASMINLNVGIDIKIFNVHIWKGYSDTQLTTTLPRSVSGYLPQIDNPWVESIGIGIPLPNYYMIEYSKAGKTNSFSISGKF